MKSFFAVILTALCLFALYSYSEEGRAAAPRSIYGGDDSTQDSSTSHTTGPATRTDHEHDSLYRPLRFLVVDMDTAGNPPWAHIAWDIMKSHQVKDAGGMWHAVDSAFVLLGMGCIKVSITLGKRPSVPDTIKFRDTCATSSCLVQRTLALGCWDSVRTDVLVVDSGRTICDTLCLIRHILTTDSSYAIFTAAGQASLESYAGGCSASAYGSVCLKKLPDGTWLLNMAELTNPYYPFKACNPLGTVCTDTVCCIPASLVWQWLGVYGYWYVPGVVTVEKTDTYDEYINCVDSVRYPSVIKEITNCRTVGDTIIRHEYRTVWIPAGRDTTVWDDTCDCLAPRISCSAGYFDSTLTIRPVFRKTAVYDTTLDTSKCQVLNLFPGEITTHYHPKQKIRCMTEGEWYASSFTKYTLPAPGRVPIAVSSVYGSLTYFCWDCEFNIESWEQDPGLTYVWVNLADLPPCFEAWCEVHSNSHWEWTTCCLKDTTTYVICLGEPGELPLLDSIQWKTPDLDVPCPVDTISIKIKIIGWTDVLVRYDTSWQKAYHPGGYVVVSTDTCCHDPGIIVDGVFHSLCPPPTFRTSCGKPILWDGSGFVIPCEDTDSMVTMDHMRLVTSRLYDSLIVLRGLILDLQDSSRAQTLRLNQLVDSSIAQTVRLNRLADSVQIHWLTILSLRRSIDTLKLRLDSLELFSTRYIDSVTTSGATLTKAMYMVIVATTTETSTPIVLPKAMPDGKEFVVKKADAGSGYVTITCETATEMIDGYTTLVISSDRGAAHVKKKNKVWWVY